MQFRDYSYSLNDNNDKSSELRWQKNTVNKWMETCKIQGIKEKNTVLLDVRIRIEIVVYNTVVKDAFEANCK